MTGSTQKIEGLELARALEVDQQQQRQEDQAAMQHEQDLADRLATELAKRSGTSPGF